jgi:hypothetical protein
LVVKTEHSGNIINEGDQRAIYHLKKAITGGKHWYLALLESIKLWKSPEELFHGRLYRYLIEGEAFDWLLLAERLCREIDEYIPEKEKIDFLFHDRPPVELPNDQFKSSIGSAKYRAYLNYLYGVLVEESLVSAVVEDIRKERRAAGWDKDDNVLEKAYKQIYGQTHQALFDRFKREKNYTRRKNVSLGMLREFTYWSFKYRIKHCDKSRVASDTKKALVYMQRTTSLKKRTIG